MPAETPLTSNLVTRLREALRTRTWVNLPEDIAEAASEIERLHAALQKMLSADMDWEDGEVGVGNRFRIIARTALSGDSPPAVETKSQRDPMHVAGDRFVEKFKREPTKASDCAWINGFVEACSPSAQETTLPQPSRSMLESIRAALAREIEATKDLATQGRLIALHVNSTLPRKASAEPIPGTWDSPTHWVCSCKRPGNINSDTVSICKDCGTVRPTGAAGYQTYPGEPITGIYEAGVGIVRLGKDDEATGE